MPEKFDSGAYVLIGVEGYTHGLDYQLGYWWDGSVILETDDIRAYIARHWPRFVLHKVTAHEQV